MLSGNNSALPIDATLGTKPCWRAWFQNVGKSGGMFPEAAIGGYLSSLGNHGDTVRTTARSLPPAIRLDGPEIAIQRQPLPLMPDELRALFEGK